MKRPVRGLDNSTAGRTFAAFLAIAVLAAGTLVAALPDNPAGSNAPSSGADPGPSPTLGAEPPDLADNRTVILFDGSSWDGWVTRDGSPSAWNLRDSGSIEVAPGNGDALSKETFRDLQLHIEFRVPEMAGAQGQARGNSGVYLHGLYEVQVLDSFGLISQINDCGAIYGVAPPLVNACRPPGEWQTYDITFRAPRFDADDNITENPRITVLHNGIVIQNNVEIPASTRAAAGTTMVKEGPILLQDHGNLVRYRNIWARRLD